MKNLAVVNCIDLSPYALKDLGKGRCAFDEVMLFCENLPDTGKTVLLADDMTVKLLKESCDDRAVPNRKIEVRSDWSVQSVLEIFERECAEDGSIFYFHGDCPFLDSGVTRKMYKNHLKYFADYTFADGYPRGITPEILTPSTAAALRGLAENGGRGNERDALFELIRKDINAFDVETEISPKDLRLLRADLFADSLRNFLLLRRIKEKGGEDGAGIIEVIENHPRILRTLPAYFNIQIVEGCPQNCFYCPYPKSRGEDIGKKGEMKLDVYERILDQVESFCEDGTVGMSLWGEPGYHSSVADLVSSTARRRLNPVIETSGIGWKNGAFKEIAEKAGKLPLWIVSLDAWSEEVYSRMRGDGMKEALDTVAQLEDIFPGNVYVQAVRMNENEDDLEHFYRNWKEKETKLIIQKYDNFCGELQDRRVADLSPLKRFPCWHVKRDVTILLDGDVVLCREDLNREHVLGNILKEPLEDIWQRGEAVYERHITGDYPELCRDCDEYYTFNF